MRLLAFILVLSIGSGCDYYESKAAPPSSGGYDQVKAELLAPFCLRCHSGSGAAGGYSFESFASTLLAVSPRDSGNSILCQVLMDGVMPPRGAKPQASLVALACDWIDKGAEE